MGTRYGNKLCPIFRADGETIDLGSTSMEFTGGTVTATIAYITTGSITTCQVDSFGGAGALPSILAGTVSVTIPHIVDWGATGSATGTATGVASGELVIVTPLGSLPGYGVFMSARPTSANTLTFQFYRATGSALTGVTADFAWRKITNA